MLATPVAEGDLTETDSELPPDPDDRHTASNGFEVWISTLKWQTVLSFLMAVLCSAIIFRQMQPGLIFTDTITTGGDMGAHVLSPQYLKEHLLPNLQLTGWSDDWYAGYPVYQFYMVLPGLMIVLLDIGLPLWLGIPAAASLIVASVWFYRRMKADPRRGATLVGGLVATLGGIAAIACIDVPPNVAFKLVTISGPVMLPISVWFFARWARFRNPGPALAALGAAFFVLDSHFQILGGNGASTLAGEFSFAISLNFAILGMGLIIRGLETGKGWSLTAVVVGLCLSTHVIPMLSLIPGAAIAWMLRPGVKRLWWVVSVGAIGSGLSAFWLLPFYLRSDYLNDMGWERSIDYLPNMFPQNLPYREVLLGLAFFGAIMAFVLRIRFGMFVAILATVTAVQFRLTPQARLWNARLLPVWFLCLALLAAVALYVIIGALTRLLADVGQPRRVLAGLAGAFSAAAFVYMMAAWAAHASPYHVTFFMVLCVLALGVAMGASLTKAEAGSEGLGVAVGTAGRNRQLVNIAVLAAGFLAISATAIAADMNDWFIHSWAGGDKASGAAVLIVRILFLLFMVLVGLTGLVLGSGINPKSTTRIVRTGLTAGSVIAVLLAMVLPIRWVHGLTTQVPSPSIVKDGSTIQLDAYRVGPFVVSSPTNVLPGWANWNYGGLERTGAWDEFKNLMDTMERVGKEHGCGRAMWEYFEGIGSYGTPMAPMLLPMFTDGCIGSMEGLFFEASMTTPFHFLNQSELSKSPSSPMRSMPYKPLNVADGVRHLQLYGVKYYMAKSKEASEQAAKVPALTEIARVPSKLATKSTGADGAETDTVEDWVIYEVADSDLVVPLPNQPVVMSDVAQGHATWLDPTIAWYQDFDAQDVFLAADGPKEWQRVNCGARPEKEPIGPQHLYGRACKGSIEKRPAPDVTVSNVKKVDGDIRFTVSKVGTPILVKTSYFPRWKVDGAEGPYRVSPNLMVVVPTEKNVELYYSRTGIDYLAILVTLLSFLVVCTAAYFQPWKLIPTREFWGDRHDLWDPNDHGDVDEIGPVGHTGATSGAAAGTEAAGDADDADGAVASHEDRARSARAWPIAEEDGADDTTLVPTDSAPPRYAAHLSEPVVAWDKPDDLLEAGQPAAAPSDDGIRGDEQRAEGDDVGKPGYSTD